MNESDRLRLFAEIKRADAQIDSFSPERRVQAASAIRAGLLQQGVAIMAEDERVLADFAAGRLELDELVLQFYGRM